MLARNRYPLGLFVSYQNFQKNDYLLNGRLSSFLQTPLSLVTTESVRSLWTRFNGI